MVQIWFLLLCCGFAPSETVSPRIRSGKTALLPVILPSDRRMTGMETPMNPKKHGNLPIFGSDTRDKCLIV